jgi:hypothetical protein
VVQAVSRNLHVTTISNPCLSVPELTGIIGISKTQNKRQFAAVRYLELGVFVLTIQYFTALRSGEGD